MTRDQGFSLVQAYQRFSELSGRKIKTSAEEAEQVGLQKHLQTELFNHGSELLGAWIAVVREYQPLIGVLSALFGRVEQARSATASKPLDVEEEKQSV